MPDTNSGTLDRESPVTEMTRSAVRPSRSAAITPPTMPSGTTMTNASTASLIELISAARTNGPTALRYVYEVPKFPCNSPPSQLQVPGQQRLVHAELVVEGLHRAIGGERPEDGAAGITGEDLTREEYDQAEEKQRQDHKAEAPQKERRHRWPP